MYDPVMVVEMYQVLAPTKIPHIVCTHQTQDKTLDPDGLWVSDKV